MSPKNEIPPTKDTLAPAIISTAIIPTVLTAPILSPSPEALFNPSASTDNCRESNRLTKMAAVIHGSISASCRHVIPDKLPAVKKERDFERPNVRVIP